MNFYPWVTDYQLYRKQTPKKDQDSYAVHVLNRLSDLRRAGVPPIRLMVEDEWQKEQKPYYNIHPKIASKLCKTDLSKIPSTMLQMPRGARAVNIRFAEQHDEFTIRENMVTENRARSGRPTGEITPGSFCHGIMMVDCRETPLPNVPGADNIIMFAMDFDCYTDHDQPIYSILGITPKDGQSLQQILDDQVKKRNESYNEILKNVMRLAVTIGFLADNPVICEADVVRKELEKFRNAQTDEERNRIIDKSRRKGKNGFNIGNDLMFLGKQPMGQSRKGSGNGRELEYAHIRGGHPHAVRYGKNKEMVKIMWFSPTTVRDDLPFRED